MQIQQNHPAWLAGLLLFFSLAAPTLAQTAGQPEPAAPAVHLVPQLGQPNRIRALAYSPDGKLAASSGGPSVTLYDPATGTELRRLAGPRLPIHALIFSPDSRRVLAGARDGTARLWDAATGKQLLKLTTGPEPILAVAFSPNGKLVLTAGEDRKATLWDATTGAPLATYPCPDVVTAVAFASDGKSFITANTATISQWDASSRTASGPPRELKRLAPEAGIVLALSQDGRLALRRKTPDAEQSSIWDIETDQHVQQIDTTGDEVHAVFSDDNTMLAVIHEFTLHRIALWNVRNGEQRWDIRGDVSTLAFAPDGQSLLGGGMRFLQAWNTAEGEELQEFPSQSNGMKSATFTGDGRYLLTTDLGGYFEAGFGGVATLWDTLTGKAIRTSEQPQGDTDVEAISPDGRLIARFGGANNTALVDAATGNLVRTLAKGSYPETGLSFSADAKRVLVVNEDGPSLWSVNTGSLLHRFSPYPEAEKTQLPSPHENDAPIDDESEDAHHVPPRLFSAAISPDRAFIVTGQVNHPWRIWDASTGEVLQVLGDPVHGLDALAISPDSHTIFTVTGSMAHLWEATTGKQLQAWPLPPTSPAQPAEDFPGAPHAVTFASFSPDGKQIAMTNGATVVLWDIASGIRTGSLIGHTEPVNSVDFSRDGRFLVTASTDKTVRLWNASTGAELATLVSYPEGGWAVTDPQGRFDTGDLDGGAPFHWVLADDPFHALPLEIFERDYYTPRLLARILAAEKLPPVRSIAEIPNRLQPALEIASVDLTPGKPNHADVVVHAKALVSEAGQTSGLADLRLFRDGQMVGYKKGALADGEYRFEAINLPTAEKDITFTSYAFSRERIKSATETMSLSIIPTARRKPRAFLLQIGVDHYQASSCDLRFSGMDAQRLSTALDTALHTRGFEVIAVRLTSETSSPGATKQEIRQALAHIAAQATPDDLFVLSFSGHGYGTKAGEFYIMPSDIQGSCYVPDQALLQNAISATELADWLRPIDAGELTFVLDACFSARSVESNDFKPGPMGSAGLGQLAYDKRMRILAASQSDQTAEEYASLQSGLLTYVLAEQGLVEHKADWQPRDGKILLGEWLAYAAAAVPIFEQNGMEDPKAVSPDDRAARSRQLPAVFDFTKADALVLATVPHAPAAGHNAQARPQP